MRKYLWPLLLISSLSFAQDKYFGATSTEAELRFQGKIQVTAPKTLTVEQLNSQTTRALEIQQLVDDQLQFLIGHLQSQSFLASFRFPGVLGDKYKFTFTKVDKRENNLQVLHYRFVGKTVFDTKAFARRDEIELPLRLPLNLETFYDLGVVRGKNRCTDPHYDFAEDLFYFWDPDQKGCPLKNNTTDVLRISGTLKRLQNTKTTYPEYQRLYAGKELKISVLVSYIEDVTKSDVAFHTFENLTKELMTKAFKLVEKKNFKTINYLARFEKNIRNQLGQEQKISLTLLLSDSDSTTKDTTFEKAYTDALMNSQILAYDGHSGLGGILNPDRFAIQKLPAFYQIYFFNACSSYPYYNSTYFKLKPAGKKNLDIITAGLPTITSTSVSNMMAFLEPFIMGRIHSYQTILRSLERSNDDLGTYLMGVIGDEDNVFKPEGRVSSSLPAKN